MTDPDTLTPEQEYRVLTAWLGYRVSQGVLTMAYRWKQLRDMGRLDEANDLWVQLMPSLLQRAVEFQDHFTAPIDEPQRQEIDASNVNDLT